MKSRAAICAVVVVASVIFTFGRTITFDFVGGWDDGPLIVDNPLINPPTGMKELLAGMLSLAAIWQYLAFTTETDKRRRSIHYALATAAFALALLAKPSSVVVPFMLIVIEWLMLRRPIGRTIRVLLPWA